MDGAARHDVMPMKKGPRLVHCGKGTKLELSGRIASTFARLENATTRFERELRNATELELAESARAVTVTLSSLVNGASGDLLAKTAAAKKARKLLDLYAHGWRSSS